MSNALNETTQEITPFLRTPFVLNPKHPTVLRQLLMYTSMGCPGLCVPFTSSYGQSLLGYSHQYVAPSSKERRLGEWLAVQDNHIMIFGCGFVRS